jgi:hypothetical protein
LCVFLGLALGACKPKTDDSLSFKYDNYRLEIFQSFTLEIDGDYDYDDVEEWTSSNPDVLSVENGVVTALKAGSAVISAKIGKTVLTCNVTVKATSDVPMLVFDGIEEISALVGDTYELNAYVYYKGVKYDDLTVTYEVADTTVATVSGNVFEMKKVGETTVYVSADWRSYKNSDYLKTSLPLKVNDDVLAKIDQKQANVYMVESTFVKFGETYPKATQLTAVVLKDGVPAPASKIVWNSTDEDVATVNAQGVVTAVSNGTAEVTVSYVDGDCVCTSNPITVTVSKPIVDGTRYKPVLIDCFTGNDLLSSAKDKVTYDFSSLIDEGYAVTSITDVTSGEPVAYNAQTKELGDVTIGEQVWLIENDVYAVKMNVICATKVITTAQEFMDIQKYGNVSHKQYTYYYNGDQIVDAYNYSGYFALGNDITFKTSDYGADGCVQMKFTSIGINGKQFKEIEEVGFSGTFNGLGYKLENMLVGEGGAFGNLAGAGTIKNLSLVNAKFKVFTWRTTGIVACCMSGTLENVNIDVDFDQISYDNNRVRSGALAYHLHNVKLQNVYFSIRDIAVNHSSIAFWVTGDNNKVTNVIVSNTTNPYVGVSEGNGVDAFSQIKGVGEGDSSDNDVSVDDGNWN